MNGEYLVLSLSKNALRGCELFIPQRVFRRELDLLADLKVGVARNAVVLRERGGRSPLW